MQKSKNSKKSVKVFAKKNKLINTLIFSKFNLQNLIYTKYAKMRKKK